MKIVHIQKVAGVGGSERHLMLLLPGLIAMGHDVQMMVLDAPGSERLPSNRCVGWACRWM